MLPPGFAPSLSLGLGGGPSQAINDAGVNSNEATTGPFAVGSGASATQTNTRPITSSGSPAPGGSPFQQAGMLGDVTGMMQMAFVGLILLIAAKKLKVV